ncbi:MAG TPA: hypothetical protein VEY95_18310 [Azospirillaceae bacterium]|nr:hypothetical protein [Azospirillaceae bacterium]
MSKRTILAATLALSTAFATGAVAQTTPGGQAPAQGQGGGMPHSSGDMQAMMDRCNRLMQQPAANATAQQQQERRDCDAMMRSHGMSGGGQSGGTHSGSGHSGAPPKR